MNLENLLKQRKKILIILPRKFLMEKNNFDETFTKEVFNMIIPIIIIIIIIIINHAVTRSLLALSLSLSLSLFLFLYLLLSSLSSVAAG